VVRIFKTIIKFLVFIILLLVIGGYIGYQYLGLSGQDAVVSSGIVFGHIVGLYQGIRHGQRYIVELSIAVSILSLPLVLISLSLRQSHHDLVMSYAYFAIGFSFIVTTIFSAR